MGSGCWYKTYSPGQLFGMEDTGVTRLRNGCKDISFYYEHNLCLLTEGGYIFLKCHYHVKMKLLSYRHKNSTNRDKKTYMCVMCDDFLPMDEYIDSLSENSPVPWD